MADLTGAGVGVLMGVLLMHWVGTPVATFWCSFPVLVAAFLASRGWWKVLPLLLCGGMVILSGHSTALLEQQRQERGPVIYRHWDAMAKIKVYGFGPEYRSINIDNLANTGTYGFDGNWDRAAEDRFEFGIDVSYLIGLFDSATFLSLGAGGGADVLQALQAGASEIHAVEVNPHINQMLLDGDPVGYILPSPEAEWLAAKRKEMEEARKVEAARSEEKEAVDSGEAVGGDEETEHLAGEESKDPEPAADPEKIVTMAEFSGHIYRDSRVRVVSEDARAYVRRFENHFDLIYSLSSNSFAALASGAFAMAENYLFTTEAFEDYWRALSDDGFLMMEHQFYMPRLVAALMDALNESGVKDSTAHLAVYDLPKVRRNILLLSKRPLSDEIRRHALGELTAERYDDIHLLYPAPEGLEDNLIQRIVLEGWKTVAPEADLNISPSVDDRPFIGQMGLWRNLSRGGDEERRTMEIFGYPLSKVILLTILLVLVVLVVPLNLIPYLGRGAKLRSAPWFYFFFIGMAFMAVEVVLIQKYTLFMGPSAYSIAIILMTLLVASGFGSLWSERFRNRTVFFAVVGWLMLDVLLFRHLPYALGGLELSERILITAALVAPLGFFLGMPFPKGALKVGELVDWGLAVNGAASVLGATLVLLVAFRCGFSVALLGAAALYLVAFGLLSRDSAWS